MDSKDNSADKVLKVLYESRESFELNTANLLSNSEVQRAILKNLIEIKYILLRQQSQK